MQLQPNFCQLPFIIQNFQNENEMLCFGNKLPPAYRVNLVIVNEAMVMKPEKLLCYMFLLAFLALTVHKPQEILKVLEQLTNGDVHVKIFNCSVNIKTKDCAQSRSFPHKLQKK